MSDRRGRRSRVLTMCRQCFSAVPCFKHSGHLTPVDEALTEYTASTARISSHGLSPNVRALVCSPKRFPRPRVTIAPCQITGGESREEHLETPNDQPHSIHKSFSKSASELPRFQSGERLGELSPQFPRDGAFGGTKQRRITHPGRSKIAFISTLKNMLGQNRHKEKRRLVEQARSNSHPGPQQQWPSDLSVDRQDSMTGYGGDTSSAEQSSSATPYSLSPRHVFGSHPGRTNLQTRRQQAFDTTDSTSPGIQFRSDLTNMTSNVAEEKSSATDMRDSNDPMIRALRQHSFFQLHVHLKRGVDLVPRDTCVTRLKKTNRLAVVRCTSDPYVKFKVGGKVVFKSKTVYKDLNPCWDETFVLGIEDPFEPVLLKVFDYDWGLQDDFMGLATIDLTALELNKSEDLTLVLHEPGKHDYMGTIVLNVSLVPKTQEEKEQYLQRGGSRLHEQQRRLKSQIWSSVVTIVLVEGKGLLCVDPGGLSDPYVKFRLGNEKYKSKVELRTLNPRWLEQFDFHLFEDQSQLLEISVWDKDPKAKDDFIGRCTLDMRNYERENTHEVWADLEGENELGEGKAGRLFLLLTISGTTSSASISDLISHRENPNEIRVLQERYKVTRTFHNLRDVGLLTIKIFRAQGLAAADFGVGKSDPFCVLELVNSRLQTQTEYKTLSPSWNKIFTFDVKDIHSVLEVTVYDEDRDHKVDFLGKIAIPLLRIKNGEKKWYALKDKKLRVRAKGNYPEILMECSVYWNGMRAAIQSFEPKEEKYMQIEQKFKRQIFVRNVNRIRSAIMDIIDFGLYIKSCFEWESPFRSVVAFVLFMVTTFYFDVYMFPAFLLLLFFKNYIVISIVGTRYHHKDDDAESSGNEDEIDEDDKDKEEKKSLKERLQAIQEVIASVQNAIGYIASNVESVKNTFNFTIPFLSWLMVLVLAITMVILYMIPVRFLVMLWGVNKFSRKLIRPNSIVNNEIADFLSRVPDDEELRDFRELKTNALSQDERRRECKKKKSY